MLVMVVVMFVMVVVVMVRWCSGDSDLHSVKTKEYSYILTGNITAPVMGFKMNPRHHDRGVVGRHSE